MILRTRFIYNDTSGNKNIKNYPLQIQCKSTKRMILSKSILISSSTIKNNELIINCKICNLKNTTTLYGKVCLLGFSSGNFPTQQLIIH